MASNFRASVNKWGGILFGVMVVFGLGSIAVQHSSQGSTNSSALASSSGNVMSRTDFKRTVIGKTEQEIIAAIGRPSQTQDMGGMQMWYYEERTQDPATGTADHMAQVTFENGRAVGVNFM